jgi:penicillin-binding protein-related factor A (putative recombinase)
VLESGFSKQIRDDLKSVYGDKIHINLIHDMGFTGKKPYDFYFNYQDHFTAVECKLVKGHTFNLENQVYPHQPKKLQEVKDSGGTGIFLVCFWNHKMVFIFTAEMYYWMKKNWGDAVKFDKFLEESKGDTEIYKIERKKYQSETRWVVEDLINVVALI